MKTPKYTINAFRKEFPNDDACLDYILKLRMGKTPCCPQCSQETTFKRIPGRRCYQCSDKDCQYHFYPTAGTVFEGSTTSLANWFYAIYLMTSTRNGVSGKELERQLGVTYKTAWRMGHQIRKLMTSGSDLMTGVIEADETYVGGNAGNKHKKEREALSKNGSGYANKIPVFGMVQRDGAVYTQVLDGSKATGAILKPIIQTKVSGGAQLITDGFGGYSGLHKA